MNESIMKVLLNYALKEIVDKSGGNLIISRKELIEFLKNNGESLFFEVSVDSDNITVKTQDVQMSSIIQ